MEKVISCAHSRALITFQGLLHSFFVDLDPLVFFVLNVLRGLVSFSFLFLLECGLNILSLLLLLLFLLGCFEGNGEHHLLSVFFLRKGLSLFINNAYLHGCEVASQCLGIVWCTALASNKSSSHVHHDRGDLLGFVLIVHRFA